MAREFVEDLYYEELRRSMAGVNSYSGSCVDNGSPDMFDAIKRKFVRVQASIEQNYKNVFQGLGFPVSSKRKTGSRASAEDELTSLDWPCPENIEMEQLSNGEPEGMGKGHEFVLCQLTNPTWCDKCGDFIWGISKQCLRCKHCQYTCHHNCVQSVALDCKTVSQNEQEEHLAGSSHTADFETSLSSPSLSKRTPSSISISKDNVQTQSSELSQKQEEQVPESKIQCADSKNVPSLQTEDVAATPVADSAADNTNEKDETDSGYRSGTIPDEKLPKMPSQATLNREELKKKLDQFNKHVACVNFELKEDGESFQGFIKVTLNLIRPITMSLSVRPPSIYDLLTREHIVEQNTQSMSFYMPRDTIKSIHVQSTTTTKEVIASLLKKFHILDHPRKFAMYEQEINKNKIVKLRRVKDLECPLALTLEWDAENIQKYRLVLQENETGEIVWDAFSLPELNNFLRVLDREQDESISQLQYKYKMMKRIMLQRMKELRKERKNSAAAEKTT